MKNHSLNFLIKNESSFFNNNFELIFCSSVKDDLSLFVETNFLLNFLWFNSLWLGDKSITEFRLNFPNELLFVVKFENFLFNFLEKW